MSAYIVLINFMYKYIDVAESEDFDIRPKRNPILFLVIDSECFSKNCYEAFDEWYKKLINISTQLIKWTNWQLLLTLLKTFLADLVHYTNDSILRWAFYTSKNILAKFENN